MGRFVMRYSPLSSVVVLRVMEVVTWVAEISTWGSTPPEESRTTPNKVAVELCASRLPALKKRIARQRILYLSLRSGEGVYHGGIADCVHWKHAGRLADRCCCDGRDSAGLGPVLPAP